MKKNVFAVSIVIALAVLSGASVWEGAAAVSTEFPESGLYVATNSFPRNTIVDLTNLETGKTVRVIVSAGLDTPGLLAQVSREAAEAIGLRGRTVGRIRMIAPSDPIAFSRFPEEFRSGDPDFDPLAAVEDVYGPGAAAPAVPESDGSGVPLRSDPESAWVNAPAAAVAPVVEEPPVVEEAPVAEAPPLLEEIPAAETPVETAKPIAEAVPAPPVVIVVPEPAAVTPPAASMPPAVVPVPETASTEPAAPYEYSYSLVPAEERPPLGAPGGVIPSTPAVAAVPQIFSVPAVAELERGRYYLQIGAYSHVPAVEQELGKIERSYPLTVQCISLSEKPAYRILIGPVNQGEAGALLRKYMAKGYKDAFVRRAP